MKRKIFKILGIILLIVFILGVALLSWTFYKIETGQLVKWEGKWYTQEELKEKYPPQQYEVEAKNTPEEVYKKFREAVINNNKEKALQYIVEDQREKYRQAFQNEDKFDSWVKKLPEEINREKENKNRSYYDLDMETEYKNTAIFIKTKEGYWKIESI